MAYAKVLKFISIWIAVITITPKASQAPLLVIQ
jgi:hypothetical protein